MAPERHDPDAAPETARLVRTAAVLAIGGYVVWLVFAYRYHFLDGVNLLVHEAGHVLLGPLGEVVGVLGGTLLQLALPIAFVASFGRRGARFEAGVCGVWAAESLMYTAEYLGDAREQALPLVGGHVHDWNWLLGRAGLLEASERIGLLLHVVASVAAVVAWWVAAREVAAGGAPGGG